MRDPSPAAQDFACRLAAALTPARRLNFWQFWHVNKSSHGLRKVFRPVLTSPQLQQTEARPATVTMESLQETFETLRQKNRSGIVDHPGFCSDPHVPVRCLARAHHISIRNFFRLHP